MLPSFTRRAAFSFLALLSCALSAPAQARPDDLVVLQFVIAQRVVEREPQGVGDQLPPGTTDVFAFARLNYVGAQTAITYVWSQDGKEVRRQPQTVQNSTGWRSYAAFRGLKPGKWRVELLDEAGAVIADREFTAQ